MVTEFALSRTVADTARVFDLSAFGDRPALHTAQSSLTYRELDDRVKAAVERLGTTRRLVVIAAANDVDTIVAYLAAVEGGHPVMLVDGARPDHVEGAVTAYDADVVFARAPGGLTLVERRTGTAHELHPDLAVLMSTSGSTGSSKLVRLSRTNIGSNALSIAAFLGIRPTDRAATTLPAHYCYGLSVINSHLMVGAGLVLTDLSVVDACFWELFETARATTFAGVPYTFELLEGSGFAERDLSNLRYVTQAGGRLDPERVKAFSALGIERGWDLCVMYGQTEATARMAYLPPALAATRPGAIGVPIPGGELRLEPIDGLDDPHAGELVFRGDNVMMGYAQEPADLARGPELAELRTGDIARRHRDGLFEIIGRRSRLAKVFGLRIDLDDLERHLAERGTPARCVAIGNTIQAFVRRRRDARPVAAFLAEHCGITALAVRADYIVDEPRTASGKTDFAALERQARILLERAAERTVPAVASAEFVRDLYAELLGRPDATVDSSFVDLGGDSLSYAEVSVRLGEVLDRLPRDWHLRPITALVVPAGASPRRGTFVETSVVLRAACILLIVGTHSNLFTILGGAHTLLAVAGYNFARFQLNATRPSHRLRQGLSAIAQIAVPAFMWIGAVAVIEKTYDWPTLLFLNGLFGSNHWTVQWQFWFIETLIWSLAAVIAILAIPAVGRIERRVPFGFALAVVAAASALRLVWTGIEAGPTERYTPAVVFWCFVLGWAAAKASSVRQRLLLTIIVVASVYGFFEDTRREAVIVAGILALVWIGGVQLPRAMARGLGVIAAASLFIYLTHWQIYPHLEVDHSFLALLSSVAVGLLVHRLARPVMRLLAVWILPAPGDSGGQ